MKILVPLSNVDNYEELVEAGADEFYSGFVPYSWLEKYGMWQPINRREFMNTSNICSLSSMKILSSKVKKYGVSVKITFNGLNYTPAQYEMIKNIIEELIGIGFNTFIIADLGLIHYLREHDINCTIHVSGEAAVFNHESMAYLNQYNVSRFVFPRKTSIEEMKKCIEKNGREIEYEAFILNENCVYVGAFCNTLHCDEMSSACFLPYKVSNRDEISEKMKSIMKFYTVYNFKENKKESLLSESYHIGNHGCGICYLERLQQIGITNMKIVGRGKEMSGLIEDVKYIRGLLKAIKENKFECKVKELRTEMYGKHCPDRRMFCYYPQGG